VAAQIVQKSATCTRGEPGDEENLEKNKKVLTRFGYFR
jgi:hypothetical protein